MKTVRSYNEIKNYLKDKKKLNELLAIHEMRSTGTCSGSCCNRWFISYTFGDLSAIQAGKMDKHDVKITLIWSNGTGVIQEPSRIED